MAELLACKFTFSGGQIVVLVLHAELKPDQPELPSAPNWAVVGLTQLVFSWGVDGCLLAEGV